MAQVITEKNLLDLKNNLTTAKYSIVQAEATYNELLKTLDTQQNDLKQFGIDSVDSVDEFVLSLQTEVAESYNKYNALYESINAVLNK
jgi:hypothetical protein